MNVNIIVTPDFARSAKKLLKKYKSLNSELGELNESLKKAPLQGSKIGEKIYKIRLAIRSKGKGKSGGARVITYVDIRVKKEVEITSVYLLKIYDKSDFESVSNEHITQIVSKLNLEEEE